MSGKFYFQRIPLSEVSTFITKGTCPVILVVDDDPLVADTLTAILNKRGYSAVTAYNGEEAFAIARQIKPQFLITDIVMPGMSGIDLAVTIKKLYPDCRTTLFSGTANHDQLHLDPRYAQHDFPLLSKPVHPDILLAHISRLAIKAA